MDHLYTSVLAFIFLALSIHVGRNMFRVFPRAHLDNDTKEAVKRGLALVTTLTALVLGLLISTGKASFDKQSETVAEMVSEAAVLDEMLAHYGRGAEKTRHDFGLGAKTILLSIWNDTFQQQQEQLKQNQRNNNEMFLDELVRLPAADEHAHFFKDKAAALATSLIKLRYKLATLQHSVIPPAMLVIIILWLSFIFLSLGFCSPANATALISEYAGALCATAALLLITELDNPFTGFIQISREPISIALRTIGG
jgi:hypothetical protein